MDQSGASILNIDSNFDGGACQRVTHTLEERTSLVKKSAQQLPSLSRCWKEMLGICSFKSKIFTNKEVYKCICE